MTDGVKKEQERKRNHPCDPVEAERIEYSREGLWPTGLTAPERSREARRETCTLALAAGGVLVIDKAVPVERGDGSQVGMR